MSANPPPHERLRPWPLRIKIAVAAVSGVVSIGATAAVAGIKILHENEKAAAEPSGMVEPSGTVEPGPSAAPPVDPPDPVITTDTVAATSWIDVVNIECAAALPYLSTSGVDPESELSQLADATDTLGRRLSGLSGAPSEVDDAARLLGQASGAYIAAYALIGSGDEAAVSSAVSRGNNLLRAAISELGDAGATGCSGS